MPKHRPLFFNELQTEPFKMFSYEPFVVAIELANETFWKPESEIAKPISQRFIASAFEQRS